MKLWIDDERVTPAGFTRSAQSSAQAIRVLEEEREYGTHFELVSFDHDLGWTADGEDNSKPVLHWIIENNYWPDRMQFHTANYIAHKWLRLLAQEEAPETTFVDLRDPWKDYTGQVLLEFGIRDGK